MSAEVDELLHGLVQRLRPQVDERADALLGRLRDELPGLWEQEDLAVLAFEEITGHLTTFLDLLDAQGGLLLVARMADRWGTRHSRDGKVIWAEQPLPREDDGSGGGAQAVPGVDLTITVPSTLDDAFPSA